MQRTPQTIAAHLRTIATTIAALKTQESTT